ncbi:50S ribosomal protein L24P [Candidatus Haloredivivus sp. G17]|jgi:large subunit ribosomal protein L24|nr:50S ribosomal protein L24P [Candidatus Haloredivivus sp. G17]
MVQRTENWSREWNSSTNPTKQRKYRENAPMHVKDKLVSANLNETLREELGTRNLPVKIGDRAEVMRGDERGAEGIISNIDREEEKLYINNLDRQKTDGTVKEIALRPSNVQLQALNLEDPDRIEKYGVDDFADIEVEEEELEEIESDEDEEMMEELQQQAEQREKAQEQTEEVEDEVEEEEPEQTEESSEASTEEIVKGTIDEVKEAVEDGADVEEVLEAEKDNKDRKTLKNWLEERSE